MKPDAIAILADDLTGANDTGVQFSRLGGAVLVLVSLERLPSHLEGRWDAVVVNTGSRNVAAGEAQGRVSAAHAYLQRQGVPLVYKKIDSTLRGNLIPELKTLFARGVPAAILAPAFPLNGRTVERGVLKVGGVPVDQTEAGRDGLSPVASGDIPAMLAPAFPSAVGAIGLDVIAEGPAALNRALAERLTTGINVIVCDAVTQSHLAAVAAAIRPRLPGPVLVGSAGLARELAAAMLSRPGGHAARSACRRVLIAAGSRSAVTAGQVAQLRAAGLAVEVVLNPADVDAGWSDGRARALGAAACDAFASGADESRGTRRLTLLLALGQDDGTTAEQFHLRSDRLNRVIGAAIAEAEQRWPGTGLVLTGGDVAAAAIEALGAEGIDLGAEVMPGIPMGTLCGGGAAGVPLVTKAGAFGSEDALLLAVAALRGG